MGVKKSQIRSVSRKNNPLKPETSKQMQTPIANRLCQLPRSFSWIAATEALIVRNDCGKPTITGGLRGWKGDNDSHGICRNIGQKAGGEDEEKTGQLITTLRTPHYFPKNKQQH
jgi:hypothetical protein